MAQFRSVNGRRCLNFFLFIKNSRFLFRLPFKRFLTFLGAVPEEVRQFWSIKIPSLNKIVRPLYKFGRSVANVLVLGDPWFFFLFIKRAGFLFSMSLKRFLMCKKKWNSFGLLVFRVGTKSSGPQKPCLLLLICPYIHLVEMWPWSLWQDILEIFSFLKNARFLARWSLKGILDLFGRDVKRIKPVFVHVQIWTKSSA